MNFIDKYNIILFPENRYVKFSCQNEYININFDNLLKEIGRFYFQNPEASVNRICALIRDDINEIWNLNHRRKRKKKVSATQIKTIRRSFQEVGDKEKRFIRIPFDIAPIFFYILNIAKTIDTENSNIHMILEQMNNITIVDYLYPFHKTIFNMEYNARVEHLTDEKLIAKYERLSANLTQSQSFMTQNFSQLSMHKVEDYKL